MLTISSRRRDAAVPLCDAFEDSSANPVTARKTSVGAVAGQGDRTARISWADAHHERRHVSSVFLIAQHTHLDPPRGDETPGYRVWHSIDAE